MKDIKFVSFTDTIDILGIQYQSATMIDGSSFIFNGSDSIDVIESYGYSYSDFKSYTMRLTVDPTTKYIDNILYGEDVSVSFAAVGDKVIDVTIPVSKIVTAYPINKRSSFYATSSAMVANKKVDMAFLLSTASVQPIEGSLKLSQQVMKSILSRLRSNRFLVAEGSQVLGLLGTPSNPLKISEVITEALESVEDFYLRKQGYGTSSLFSKPDDLNDKLSSLSLISVKIDEENPDRVNVLIRMRTMAGDAIVVPIII